MYMYAHTQFSGANPERLVAAIKYFLQGKGAEKGLRWEEGRKDEGGGGVGGGGGKEGGKEVGSEREVGDEGIDVASIKLMNILNTYTVKRRRRRRRRDSSVEKRE